VTLTAADLRSRIHAGMDRTRKDLETLVAIPSVSAKDHDPQQLVRSAETIAGLLREAGAEVKILRSEGHPAVVGYVQAPPGAPSVLLYAHHDVQPPGPESEWGSPPFKATFRSGRLYGRGVEDDKAGVVAHISALRAFGGKPPVGVAVFIEGEEEAGSENLRTYLEQERERLDCDAVVVADGGNWRAGEPALTTTLRGVVSCIVELRVLDKAVHSGGFGGTFPDALTSLVHLLATLHDAKGDVAIAGIARGTAPDLDLTEDELRRQAGVRRGVESIGDGSLTDRLWMKPAVSVLAIDAPPVREAINQLVPVARAKVSMRIPPGQDGKKGLKALVDHLKANVPWGAEVKITSESSGEPFVTRTGGRAYTAMHAALSEAWGHKSIDIGAGGTIPFLFDLQELFPKAEIMVTGVGDPEGGAHGPDENVDLDELERACLAEALFLEKLAKR
jgi:acetylornithine deacetylase/succinyl-diaminopimelate desuccinylase-like protein